MPRRPPNPGHVHAAKAAHATGRSASDIARELGVSATTVRNWVALPAAGASAPVPAPTQALVVSSAPVFVRLRALADDLAESGLRDPSDLCREAADAIEHPRVVDSSDVVAFAQATLSQMYDAVQAAAAVGNHTAAQKTLRDIGALVNTIARTKARATGEEDMVSFPRRELEAAEAEYAELTAKALETPLYCAKCGAQIRVELAAGGSSGS